MEQRTDGGTVSLRAARSTGQLELAIRDNGAGIGQDLRRTARGIGLSNTALRLRQLYGAAHRIELRAVVTGGTEVTIELPFHLKPVSLAS